MQKIVIDQNKCVDSDICHICETIKQGLPAHCSEHNKLLVSSEAVAEHHKTITNFITRCPAQAITITPIDEE